MGKKNIVQVNMWGSTVGYLHQEENGMVGFQYEARVIICTKSRKPRKIKGFE